MNAIQQAQTLDDVLRLFTGWQGVLFLFVCLLALALVIAQIMLIGPVTVRVEPDDEEIERERRASLDAAVNSSIPKYMNPFMEKGSDHAAR